MNAHFLFMKTMAIVEMVFKATQKVSKSLLLKLSPVTQRERCRCSSTPDTVFSSLKENVVDGILFVCSAFSVESSVGTGRIGGL